MVQMTPVKARPLLPLLVVGACLLTVLSVVVALVLLLPGEYKPPANRCSTFECNEYGRLLSSSIDLSADPCHNFTRFVCGGWELRNGLSVREYYYERALQLITRKVRTVAVSETEQNSVQRAANVYRSCQAVLEGESDQLPEVRDALREAEITWPKDPEDQASRDAVFTIVYCSLKLGWDAVLRVDPRFLEHKTSLLINPGRSFSYIMRRRHDVNTTDFVQYFNELKKRFGGDDDHDVLLNYVKKLEKLIQRNLSDAYNARTEQQILTEAGFLGLGVHRWENVFRRLNPKRNEPLELLTTAGDFVKTFLKFWDTEGEPGAHIFTSWCTVQVAALYANRDLVLNYYGSFSRARVYHTAFCVTKAYTFSRYALLERYHVERLAGKSRRTAEHVARFVEEVFGQRLSQWRGLQGNVKVITNWSPLSRAFHGFNKSHDQELIGYNMRNDSLVANWQKSTLLPSVADDYVIVPAIESLELFALFLGERAFQLMPVSLYFPLFDLGLTAAVNYGGIGAIVAAALGRLFLHAYYSLGNAAEDIVACVHSGSGAANETSGAFEATALTLTAGALLEAYRLDNEGSFQPYPPKLQRFNANQLVLMALCFARCEGNELGNGAALCDSSLRHVKEFAEVFHCAPHTPMNPIRRCDLP